MENPRAMAPQLENLVEQKRLVDEQAAAIAEELGGNRVSGSFGSLPGGSMLGFVRLVFGGN